MAFGDEDKDKLIQEYLASKMAGPSVQEIDQMQATDMQNNRLRQDSASADLAAGLNNASALISGGRYKADNSDLMASNKSREAQISGNNAQMESGKKVASAERKAAIDEYLAGKKQTEDRAFQEKKHNEDVAFQEKRLAADDQYRQDNLNSQAENRREGREQRTYLANERAADRKETMDLKNTEKEQALKTPYGLANTVEDAKNLKSAHELKSNFDSKINEMIALREKHNGGAVLDREDVARGKQLSKDLLLQYKDMAHLGVLSQSDENILNAIIPADPLEYKMAGILGQDPILSNLKSFKKDSQKDFDTKIGTRTREGLAKGGSKVERVVVDRQVNPKQPGKMKLVYNDGSSEIVDTGKVANNGASGGF